MKENNISDLLSKHEFTQALEETFKLISLETLDSLKKELRIALISIYARMQNHEKTLSEGERFLEIYGQNLNVLLWLQEASYQLNLFDQYTFYNQLAQEKYSNETAIIINYSRFIELTNDKIESLNILKDALPKHPSILETYLRKAIPYATSIGLTQNKIFSLIENHNGLISVGIAVILINANLKDKAGDILMKISVQKPSSFIENMNHYLSRILLKGMDLPTNSFDQETEGKTVIELYNNDSFLNLPPQSDVLKKELLSASEILVTHKHHPIDIESYPKKTSQVFNMLKYRLDNEIPTSLIRLGDGEGCFLPYSNRFINRQVNDQQLNTAVWWGSKIPEKELKQIEKLLAISIFSADIIGISSPYRLIRELGAYSHLSFTRHILGVLTVNQFCNLPDTTLENVMYTSSHIHEELEKRDLYKALLNGINHVTAITCHEDLPKYIKSKFSIENVQLIKIAPEFRYKAQFGIKTNYAHFPSEFESVIERIRMDKPKVCLIAAGFLGKYYCHIVKENGGIAIDIGSIIDLWMGHATRNTHLTKIGI